MIDVSNVSISSGYHCPKCGDRLVPVMVATNPLNREFTCFKCNKSYTESELLSVSTTTIRDAERVTLSESRFDTKLLYNMLKGEFEGCELCKGAKYLSCTLHSEKPYRDGILVTEIRDDGGGAADIEYCPVCGRPLTDESLMKLAEKISNVLEDKLG